MGVCSVPNPQHTAWLPPSEAIAWLCHHGANVAAQKEDGWGDTALHYAAARGSMRSVRVLLAYGADPRATNYAGGCAATLVEGGRQGDTGTCLVSAPLMRLGHE